MKILVIGDKESSYIWDHFNPEPFKDVKLVISTGDLRPEYLSFIVTMLNVPLLYVHGNHDGKYLTNEPEGCECIDGKIISVNGLNIFGMGGSMLYNNGPFQFTDREMSIKFIKMKLSLWRKKKIDIFVGHSPALGINDGKDVCHTGFKAFRDFLDDYKPRFFLHGHNHLTYGSGAKRLSRYNDTTIINSEGYYLFDFNSVEEAVQAEQTSC